MSQGFPWCVLVKNITNFTLSDSILMVGVENKKGEFLDRAILYKDDNPADFKRLAGQCLVRRVPA
jgi:hypothetical protein